jgi:primase-polymerase (primpol)-like protein
MIEQLSKQQANCQDVTLRTGWAIGVNFENIPSWMHSKMFCVWTAEPRENGKVNKAPRHPNGGWNLSVREPDQWATLGQVKKAYISGQFDGIGVLLTSGSGVVGIDIDDWQSLIAANEDLFNTLEKFIKQGGYVERSPSGAGLRAFVKGNLVGSGQKSGGFEIYDDIRYLTVTGQQLGTLNVSAN